MQFRDISASTDEEIARLQQVRAILSSGTSTQLDGTSFSWECARNPVADARATLLTRALRSSSLCRWLNRVSQPAGAVNSLERPVRIRHGKLANSSWLLLGASTENEIRTSKSPQCRCKEGLRRHSDGAVLTSDYALLRSLQGAF